MNPQPGTLDGLPKRFVTAMRTLFDILDDKKTDSVRLSDIQQFWQDDGAKGLPKGVIESLQKVTPPSGMLTFERFCAGLKICLLRNQMESQKAEKQIMADYRKPQVNRPPSAPSLAHTENINKPPWTNTATVRPNNAMASRTLSMPQLLSSKKETFESNIDEQRPRNLPDHQPIYYPSSGVALYGPPKPPRTGVGLSVLTAPTDRSTQDRSEIRTALHNWQKGQMMQQLDAHKLRTLHGRSMGDGKAAVLVDQPKKPIQRKREPRRHTLQNGVDYNMLKKIKHIEKEKDVLLDGLAAVERTKEWYLKQIAMVQERMKYLGRVGPSAEPLSEAQSERLELQRARVLEVNRHLSALTESWQRGGLPLHMNLALHHHHLATSDLSRVKHHNRLLTKEVSEKSEKISILEAEKTSLLRELYQARGRIDKLHDRAHFM